MTETEIIGRAWRLFEKHKVSQKSREEHAEIHTPRGLADDMIDKIPKEKFENSKTTFLDPCAGVGCPFPLAITERLVNNGISYQHAMEGQVYMVEIQPKNCVMIEKLLNPTGELNLNLKCCDVLDLDIEHMEPEDWKSERFRTNYGNQYTFFERNPAEKEINRLNEIRDLTDDQEIIQQFERGYGGE